MMADQARLAPSIGPTPTVTASDRASPKTPAAGYAWFGRLNASAGGPDPDVDMESCLGQHVDQGVDAEQVDLPPS